MILVFGSINVDLVMPVSSLPKPGETGLTEEIQQMPGGKGANQAYAARRAGAETMFVGSTLSKIATTVSTEMQRAHNVFGQKPVDLRRAHYEYRKLHKEARRRNNQAELTAMTLVIIHLRADIAGIDALPARTSIEQFIGRYK